MCLYVTELNPDLKPLIAQEDIKVWKVVLLTGYGLVTLFRKVEIELGKRYETPSLKAIYKPKNNVQRGWIWEGKIDEGLHSFIHYDDAVECADSMRHSIGMPYVKRQVVECTIPKGSEIFCGVFFNVPSHVFRAIPSYASNALVYGTEATTVE